MFKRLMLALGLSATSACADEQHTWPDLPETGFIIGRAASTDDIAKGNAVFSMDGKSAGPIDIEIPQYALWRDEEGKNHPVIVVQAETAPDGTKIVGLRNADGSDTAATLPELTLLGKQRPN
jgi:hypothetical protein